jgi:hypothetical protein
LSFFEVARLNPELFRFLCYRHNAWLGAKENDGRVTIARLSGIDSKRLAIVYPYAGLTPFYAAMNLAFITAKVSVAPVSLEDTASCLTHVPPK